MKNILVPTDFSNCSKEALATAALFAEQFDARIHLLHVLKSETPSPRTGEAELESQNNLELKNVNESLEEQLKEYKNISIIPKVEVGSLVEKISDYVAAQDIEIVIMGSHGASGKQEFFIGSNTQKVVRQVHVNTLVVKNAPQQLNFKKVVFATNFDERDKKALLLFKRFVAVFSPEIHLVHINTDPFFGLPYVIINELMEEAEEIFAPLKVKTHYVRDLSVDAGVRHISENIQADLIAISNHIKRPLKRIFSGSNVEALVNHADIPVLSLDYDS